MASLPTSSATDVGSTKDKLEVEVIQDEVKAERAVELKKYEANYAQRLMSKYFSQKGMDGDEIFDKETIIGDQMIKSSRFPCTISFTGPTEIPKDENVSPSSVAETSVTPSKNPTVNEDVKQ